MNKKTILFLFMILMLLVYSKKNVSYLYATDDLLPPEVPMIILMETHFENLYRQDSFKQALYFLNEIIKGQIDNLTLSLDSETMLNVRDSFDNLKISLLSDDIEKVEEAYTIFKINIFSIYEKFNYDGSIPGKNYLLHDYEQLNKYLQEKNIKFIIYETNQILNFIQVLKNNLLNNNQFYCNEKHYFYNLSFQLLKNIRASALDNDFISITRYMKFLKLCFEKELG